MNIKVFFIVVAFLSWTKLCLTFESKLFENEFDNIKLPEFVYILEKISVQGNKKTNASLILRNIDLNVGDSFNIQDQRLEEAKYRLLALGLFYDVTFDLEKGALRGYVQLVVTVSERNTLVVRDLSFGTTRIAPNFGQVIPFGSISFAEKSFLGEGVQIGGGFAASKDQWAYKIDLFDSYFLNSRIGIHAEALFIEAQEYFGEHYLPPPKERANFGNYEVLKYRRAGIRLGLGYHLILDYFFWFDYRFENVLAEKPQTVTGDIYIVPDSQIEEKVSVGYLEPDDSMISSLLFGFVRDKTNHPILPNDGSILDFSVEITHPVMGSSYNFAKFLLLRRRYFQVGQKGHSLCLGFTAGLITGNAPFFDQFFIGDYSSFIPERKMGLNFSNLHPKIIRSGISQMWYEDLVLSFNTEYSIPLFRGSGNIYGLNLFIGAGIYSLTSIEHIDGKNFPIDISADFGIRMDTRVGVFSLSFANMLQLIPPIRRETTE